MVTASMLVGTYRLPVIALMIVSIGSSNLLHSGCRDILKGVSMSTSDSWGSGAKIPTSHFLNKK